MREVEKEEFKKYILANGLNGKGEGVSICDPALIVYSFGGVMVAKIELPNQFCETSKYFLL